MPYIPLFLYSFRWNIEVSYYEQKSFWSLCAYMVRSRKGVEMLVNLINISYCAMKLLPYMEETLSQYRGDSVQEFRFALSEQIKRQIFYVFLRKPPAFWELCVAADPLGPFVCMDGSLGADGQGVGRNDRQLHTGDCVESECILSGQASNFLYSRIPRNQTRYNLRSYSDTIEKQCIHQKKSGTRPLPLRREPGVKLVYC